MSRLLAVLLADEAGEAEIHVLETGTVRSRGTL